ncbi:MAG: RNA-binding transcriptional accessory protein [Lachnospiraceae bacterium]|nr:RNA-binding transcriptional accessory protein [Lachnospiraceae bacterium]
MNILEQLKDELGIRLEQAEAAVRLIDEGNTIPFIARYRKEVTGSLDDEVLRNLNERLVYLRNLEDRKATVLASIEEQGKLTDKLKKAIVEATTLVVVEDLYRPYRPKRRTRATIAKEKGLEGLAEYILEQNATSPVLEEAEKYVCAEKEVKNAQDAINGAMDIIAESISDNAEYRSYIRRVTGEEGTISSSVKDENAESVYEMYYKFEQKISTIAAHRILALNRGENEKVITVKINAPVDAILLYLEKRVITGNNVYTADILKKAVQDSYDRLIAPAIEREIRNDLTEKAEDSAMKVFGKNLTKLLMSPPIRGQVVLGWDPAFRTGCKLAVVDETGKVLDTTVIYPTAPQNKVEESKKIVKDLIEKYNITLISVGNGTACRESEQVIVELLKEIDRPVQYIIVSEAGASVYSASKLATEEFPNFDVGQRSAASIARRLQDPLAELVKIDPKSIGVGQYQHDMNQKKLTESLNAVVEDCVNKVGVDLNTASASLLEYISGISKTIAKNIVSYREENGRFTSRKQLLKVTKLGPKAYEQCAGFLRIHEGDNPLDDTSVHPESYVAAEKLLASLGYTTADIKEVQRQQREATEIAEKAAKTSVKRNRMKQSEKGIYVKKTGTALGNALFSAMEQEKEGGASVVSKTDIEDSAVSLEGLSNLGSKIPNKRKLAEELGIGEITLNDIVKELEKPGRDPREEMPKPILRTDVLDMKDLTEGMILKGTVRNVIDFGAFIDIGVHQDGLVHVSQMSKNRYVKHPLDVVNVGDVVEVRVLSVDIPKRRIQLSMILDNK